VLDDRQIPTTIEYRFGTGSVLAVSTKRRRAEADIFITVRLRDSARLENRIAGILFSCDRNDYVLPAPATHRLMQANPPVATTPLANIELQ
jgi:hypothetical protein